MLDQSIVRLLPESLPHLQILYSTLDRYKSIKRAVVLMGEVKAGKTTLLYYLNGRTLKMRKNELGVDVLEPVQVEGGAEVGSGFNSSTLTPNIMLSHQQKSVAVVDMPGLSDSRIQIRLLKIYSILKILQIVCQVHMCYVLPDEMLAPNELLKEMEKMVKVVRTEVVNQGKWVSFVLTKVEGEERVGEFQEGLGEIAEESEVEGWAESVERLKEKKRYVFGSGEPEEEAGLKLKESICSQNQFFSIHQQPFSLFSQQILPLTLGDSSQMTQYIDKLLQQCKNYTKTLLTLGNSIIFYEYSEIMAELEETDKDEYEQKLKKSVESLRKSVFVQGIDELEWSIMKLNDNANKYGYLRSIMTKNIVQNNVQGSLQKHIQKLVQIMTSQYQWTKINSSFLAVLALAYQNILALLSMLEYFKKSEFCSLIQQFFADKEINDMVEEMYRNWEENNHKIREKQKFKDLFEDSGQQQIRIVKVSQFKTIKDKNILSLSKSKYNSKLTDITQQQHFPIKLQFSSLDEKSINSMQNNTNSLNSLLNYLQTHQNQQQTLTRTILSKISYIFSKLSMYEQALVCAMAGGLASEVERLFHQGIMFDELTPQFVRQIAVKYYMYEENSLNRVFNYETCLNFIIEKAENEEEELKAKEWASNLRQDSDLRCNIESQQLNQINLHYVYPLLQDLPHFLALAEHREKAFEGSECLRVLKALGEGEGWSE